MENGHEVSQIAELLLDEEMRARLLAATDRDSIDSPLLRELIDAGIEFEQTVGRAEDELSANEANERKRLQQLVAAGTAHDCGDPQCRYCPMEAEGIALLVLAEMCAVAKQLRECCGKKKRVAVSLGRDTLIAAAWLESLHRRTFEDDPPGAFAGCIDVEDPGILAAARNYVYYALSAQIERDIDEIRKRTHPLMRPPKAFDESENPF